MNSRLRQPAMVGAGAAPKFDLGQEVGSCTTAAAITTGSWLIIATFLTFANGIR
jgi:hypothetical protein